MNGEGACTVILPALEEEDAITEVVRGARRHCAEVIVVDGGSRDDTAARAARAGARVLVEHRRGFGRACATGFAEATGDIVVFMDADGSFHPDDIPLVVGPVAGGSCDLCLGSRTRRPGNVQPRHLRLANRALGAMCRPAVGTALSDLGPLRAIRRDRLAELGMMDMGVGWPLEMILRAGRGGLRVREVDVRYGDRVGGTSKVTGSMGGTARVTRQMGLMIVRDTLKGGL